MIKIFSADHIRKIDSLTVKNQSISNLQLMERASSALLNYLLEHYTDNRRFFVVAGHGNNGGDALALARMLIQAGKHVKTVLVNPEGKLSRDCQANKERLEHLKSADFTETAEADVLEAIGEDDVLIDGLFGSGLNRPLTGVFADAVKAIKDSHAHIISIDVPSGLFCDDNTNNFSDRIVTADLTLTFQFPKLTFLMPENERFVGRFQIIDIGLDSQAIGETVSSVFYTEAADIRLKKRRVFSHKGTFGHALLIAGSHGKMGAAIMASRGCLRSGTGLLTMHIPSGTDAIMQASVPEGMLSFDPDECLFSQSPQTYGYTAIGAGPGLGTEIVTAVALKSLIYKANLEQKPLVLDADALNILSMEPGLIHSLPANTILTPHPREFERLCGEENTDGAQRFVSARKFAVVNNVIIVLKGAFTSIHTPDGDSYFNPTGNSGMATGGSGDVLTGMILSFLAQGYSPKDAAVVGVYLHGLAGDLAAGEMSEEGMTALDIIRHVPEAFKLVKRV